MKRMPEVAEPEGFHGQCRTRGSAWMARAGTTRPPDFWSPFRKDLQEGYGWLCGYSAIFTPEGQVDHYLGLKNYREQAYEWSNYRFASALCNGLKGSHDDRILDPQQVEDGWFEIHLPSLQLLLVEDKVPAHELERARFTLRTLKLRDDERHLRQRQQWLAQYREGHVTLEGLRQRAPLIARAVEKQDSC